MAAGQVTLSLLKHLCASVAQTGIEVEKGLKTDTSSSVNGAKPPFGSATEPSMTVAFKTSGTLIP